MHRVDEDSRSWSFVAAFIYPNQALLQVQALLTATTAAASTPVVLPPSLTTTPPSTRLESVTMSPVAAPAVLSPTELRERVSAIAAAAAPEDAAVLSELLARLDVVAPANGVAKPPAAAPVKNGALKLMAPSCRVPFDYLRAFMLDSFIAVGVPADEAEIAADVLIYADMRGIDSHGIGRLYPIYVQRIRDGIMKPTAEFTVVKETDTTALIEGNMGLGLVIGDRAARMAVEKAKKHGLGMTVVRGSTHYGAAGWHSSLAADAGCIGITGTNARASLAPTHGIDPMLGTNPLTWSVPSDDGFHCSLDAATTINQRGKIEKYAREGLPTPPGQVIDRSGAVRTDTDGILRDLSSGQCSLAPLGGPGEELGGYKGYSLALFVELLSSTLCGGKTSNELTGVDKATGEKVPMPLGHWFIAIDIERFVSLESFKKDTGDFLRLLRAGDKDPKGPGRIWTPGEKEADFMVERKEKNGTMVPAALQKDFATLRTQYPELLAEKYAKFPWE